MNSAHIHLIFVHLPILFVPLGACLLALGWYSASHVLRHLACALFLLSSLVAVPVYLTGEEAEELVEHVQGVAESAIENHEEGALVALWSTLILGMAAAVLLFQDWAKNSMPGTLCAVVMLLSLLSSLSLGYAGYLGGKIRHPEAYSALDSQGGVSIKSKEVEHKSEDEDD